MPCAEQEEGVQRHRNNHRHGNDRTCELLRPAWKRPVEIGINWHGHRRQDRKSYNERGPKCDRSAATIWMPATSMRAPLKNSAAAMTGRGMFTMRPANLGRHDKRISQ